MTGFKVTQYLYVTSVNSTKITAKEVDATTIRVKDLDLVEGGHIK